MSVWGLIFILSGCGLALCRADTLWQKSGRSLEVIILEETTDQISFTMGTGQITMPRNKIDRIEYSSAEEKQKILSKWADSHFYDNQYVPEGLGSLADAFRQLRSSHAKMVKDFQQRKATRGTSERAVDRMPECARKMELLRPQVDRMGSTLQENRSRLDKLTGEMNRLIGGYKSGNLSKKDRRTAYDDYESLRKQREPLFLQVQQQTSEYRTLLSQLEALQVEYQELVRMQGFSRQDDSDRSALVQYLKIRADFRAELQQCKAREDANQYESILNRFVEAAVRMDADVRQDQVFVSRSGGTLHTTVLINGHRSAVMIVDTGASYTTISRKFAAALNLGPLEKLPRKSIFMADGRSVQAVEIRLGSVQVGTAARTNVMALVMDEAPSPEVDGLLGMSFLKNFVMRMDADKGDLELISLRE